MYLSKFSIYHVKPIIFLWFDHPWTLNSIMGEKNKKKKEQPDSNRSLWEIFFKRAFYEMLMVNKAMVNSKVN